VRLNIEKIIIFFVIICMRFALFAKMLDSFGSLGKLNLMIEGEPYDKKAESTAVAIFIR
jgi:hypothetical protein